MKKAHTMKTTRNHHFLQGVNLILLRCNFTHHRRPSRMSRRSESHPPNDSPRVYPPSHPPYPPATLTTTQDTPNSDYAQPNPPFLQTPHSESSTNSSPHSAVYSNYDQFVQLNNPNNTQHTSLPPLPPLGSSAQTHIPGFQLPPQLQSSSIASSAQRRPFRSNMGITSPQGPLPVSSPFGFVIPTQDGFIVPDHTPMNRPIRRYNTIKRVQLQNGHLIVDVPVPNKYLEKVAIQDGVEFTHMRYTAVDCDPDIYIEQNFSLRAAQWGRHTEIALCMTMYNEDQVLFAKTMDGVMKNIANLCKRDRSKFWDANGWKKCVVVIVADGRKKCNTRVLSLLATMGIYQDGVAKNIINGKEVLAHVFEYTTQLAIDEDLKPRNSKQGVVPVQVVFCLKEKNAKKINSHRYVLFLLCFSWNNAWLWFRWFFRAFCRSLLPNICILIDVRCFLYVFSMFIMFDR